MLNISKYSNTSNNLQNNLFLFLEDLKITKYKKKPSFQKIKKNKLIIFNLLKDYDFNSLYLDSENITMYLIRNFKSFKYFFDKGDLQKIIDKCNIYHQDKYGRNFIMYVLEYNKREELGFTKDDIISFLEKIDLNQQDNDGWNVLMFILVYNKDQELGFKRDDIISILEKIDLNHQDKQGWNAVMYILWFNKTEELGFNKNDVLNLLDKSNLSQKTKNHESVYDIIINEDYNKVGLFTEQEISFLISKLDIEMTDKNNNNILIKELKNGLCFDSEKLVEKILNTENRDIIDCVYQHIDQIVWKQDKLFLFLKKNGFEINNNSFNIL